MSLFRHLRTLLIKILGWLLHVPRNMMMHRDECLINNVALSMRENVHRGSYCITPAGGWMQSEIQ